MARRKLNSIKFPDLADTYYLDADKVEYDESESYAEGSVGEALTKKANNDGYYEDMTVGDAEQLVSTMFVEDSEPYKFRTTGGSADVGNREYVDAIVGGTIAWNQLVQNGDFASITGWQTSRGTLTASNNKGTFTVTEANAGNGIYRNYIYVKDHVYFAGATLTPSKNTKGGFSFGGSVAVGMKSITANVANRMETIAKATADTYGSCYIYCNRDMALAVNDTCVYENVNVIDLTQMFGTTIADYIYSLEQSTAGAGVAWFKKLFPNDYYEYNAGELVSVSGLQSHDTVGFNAYDPSTGKAKLVGGQQYQISGTYTSVSYVTDSGNAETISISGGLFTPTGNGTLTVVGGNDTDTCVHLTWSGWRNGEYEPYQKHSYALDSSLTLRGIPKLSDGKMYYDGDEYKPDGTVTRRVGQASIAWVRGNVNNANDGRIFYFYYSNTNVTELLPLYGSLQYIYPSQRPTSWEDISKNSVSPGSGNIIIVTDSPDTTLNDFPAWLASKGVELWGLLKTPTTETAEPYNEVQICDDFGTEEYVSTSIVPVGHNTEYPANLRDKLQHLPDLADNDGYYVIQQSNKQMYLTHFRIPQAPTTDGTYVLKAVVSGGTPTYTWVDESEATE